MTPIGLHPALAFPWNKPGTRERRVVLGFLALARQCGHDVDALVELADKTRAELSPEELTGKPLRDI